MSPAGCNQTDARKLSPQGRQGEKEKKMIRMPDNRTFFSDDDGARRSRIQLVVKYLVPGAYVAIGYGPSYGVDSETLRRLLNGEVSVDGFDARLTVERHRASVVGPINQSFWTYEIGLAGLDAEAAMAEAGEWSALTLAPNSESST